MTIKERKHNYRYYAKTITQASGTASRLTTHTSSPVEWTDSVNGGSVPFYERKLALAQQATSPLIGQRSSVRSIPGRCVYEFYTSVVSPVGYRYRERIGHLCASIGIPGVVHSSEAAAAENIAREVFYAKYRSAQTSFQGGVALGELRETLRMLRSPAKALRKKVGDLYDKVLRSKRRAGKKAKDQNRAISQTWLEGSFGWRPLISDIEDAHRTLENRKEYLDRNIVVIVGVHSTTSETVLPNTVSYGSGFLGYVASTRHTKTSMVKYRGAVVCKTDVPWKSEARLWGFSPDNIIPTIWELVPYSFLIDYFTNIGKVLDAWSMRRCHLTWGARTERRVGIYQLVDARRSNTYGGVVKILTDTFDIGDWTSETKSVVRTPVNSVPLPDFRFKLPGNSTQWLNIGALVRLRSISSRRSFL